MYRISLAVTPQLILVTGAAVLFALIGCNTDPKSAEPVTLDLPPLTNSQGRIYGQVSGLENGDSVILTVRSYDSDQPLGSGALAREFELENGPNLFEDLNIAEGTYAMFVDNPGYDTQHAGRVFHVPEDGEYWQYSFGELELYSPESSIKEFEREICGYKGYAAHMEAKAAGEKYDGCQGGGIGHTARSRLSGRLFGLEEGVEASVMFLRLSALEGVTYISAPSQGEGTVFPEDLVKLDSLESVEQGETRAIISPAGRRWATQDLQAAGRYLITVEAEGYEISPAGYIASVIGGRVVSSVSGIDFGLEPTARTDHQDRLTSEQVLNRASGTLGEISSFKMSMTFDEPMVGSTEITSIETTVKLPDRMIAFAIGTGEPRFQRGYIRGKDCFTDEGLNGEWEKRSIRCNDPVRAHSRLIEHFAMRDPEFMQEPPDGSSGLHWITGSATGSWSKEELDDSIRVDRMELAFDKGSGRLIRALVYKDSDKTLYITYEIFDYNSTFSREFSNIERSLRKLGLID